MELVTIVLFLGTSATFVLGAIFKLIFIGI